MKSKQFFIIDALRKDNCLKFIAGLQPGKIKVTISDSGTKSQRQTGLNWQWNTDVYNSGFGDFDGPNDVHRNTKIQWVIPILQRDDPIFADTHEYFMSKYGHDKKEFNKYLDNNVRTQSMTTAQVSEYMQQFERCWLQVGINLTNPDLFGLKM